MITPKLRDAYSDDFKVREWEPAESATINFWLVLEIGPDDEDGTEYFRVRVAEQRAFVDDGAAVMRATVLVERERYSFETILAAIEKVIEGCGRASWSETAVALSRYFLWEYEDHKFIQD